MKLIVGVIYCGHFDFILGGKMLCKHCPEMKSYESKQLRMRI